MLDIIIFIISMSSLIYGADFIVNQSENIARHFHISSFVIGATLIALGTSLPEMAASVSASLQHSGDIAVANVIGSTIFNISLVLGFVFLIARKINPKRDLFSKDSAWSLFPILIFIVMSIDGILDLLDGIVFIFIMLAYILFLSQDNQIEKSNKSNKKESFKWNKSLVYLVIGFIFVVFGADFAISSAKSIALSFGISQWLVGLFLVAFGTSLPELVVAIKAARSNNADMAIGTIIGSNVSNFAIVLGLSSIINPLNVDMSKYFFDITTALILTVMLVFITANKMYNKSSGIVLLSVLFLVVANSFNIN